MELADGASPRVRAAAVRALGDFGIEAAEAIPVLVRILAVGGDDGGNWDGGNWGHSLRRDAEEALVCVGAPAVAPLLPFLGTADPNLGRAVVAILSRIGEPALLPVLAALSEPDPAIRAAAAAVLGNLGSPRAVPALAELVSDPDDRIRTAAGNALSRLGEKAATVALKALSDPDPGRRRWAVGALAALPGETGLEGILGALDDKETAVREEAVRALGRKGTLGLPALLRLLEAPDERTKDLAVHAMGAMRPPPADAVAALLPGAGPDKRLSLALALAGMDDDRGVPPLVECLSGRIPGSGSRAAWALRRLGARAVPHLLSVLKEGPAPARYHAAVALGGIRGSGTGPALAEALKDPDPLVRASAAEGLVRKEEELLPPAVEEALRSPAPETRFWAAVVRAHRSPAWDPGPLLEGLRLAPLLEEEVDARVRDLEGEGRRPFVRGLYVEAIRRTLPESARLLVERMTDPDEGTRAAAKEVLDCLRPDVESALLEGAKGGSGTRRYACLRILMEWRCPAAAGPALSALKDPEPEVRRIAASLLGALEAREAVEPLIALLEDDDWTVVFSAAAALRRITGLNLGRSPAEWRSRLEREKRGREEGR
jgi:HEAT repeat protein